MALLKVSKDWRTCLDIREAVSTVAVDLSKAFDSVCYGLLLAKLEAWGFSSDALLTMSAYLQGRPHCTMCKNRWSLFRTENCDIQHPTGISLGTTAVQYLHEWLDFLHSLHIRKTLCTWHNSLRFWCFSYGFRVFSQFQSSSTFCLVW